ncbi:MAG TPA: hypothetical protein DDX19_27530 [Rhodopirellula baltica]|nr:hypothetical protein [Rhodopirellula baltica]HBE66437.1 hypothetical protein [Rhodopirellula baltica]
MRLTMPIIIPLLAAAFGCQFSSHAPNPQWLADFQKTDSILIRNHDQQHVIADAEAVNRLRNVYENAKWKPYWHTLPGNLGDRTIDLQNGETNLRHFSYTGSLWETESYTENRTAELSDSDARWIESLFALVPDGESPQLPKSQITKP